MRARRGLAAAVGLALGLGLAEALLRGAPLERALLEPLVPLQVTDLAIHQPLDDPELLYGLRPGLRVELPPASERRQASRQVSTNSLGFRDPERSPAKAPGTWRVLCLGGSNTFGATVSDDETWPAQLERHLQGAGVQAEVWNLGVSGYMSRQSAALGERAIRDWAPDVLLVQVYNVGRRFLLLGDDLDRALRRNPALYAEWLWLAPAPGARGWGLWQGAALGRVGVIGLNRLLAAGPGDPGARLADYTDALDEAALRRLARLRPGLPVLALVPPSGGPEVPLPTIDLHARYGEEGEPFGPAGRDIHPEPEVYTWYAERIAAELGRQGLLPGAAGPGG